MGADIISRDREIYEPIKAMPLPDRLKYLGKDALHVFRWVLDDFHELGPLDPVARHLKRH